MGVLGGGITFILSLGLSKIVIFFFELGIVRFLYLACKFSVYECCFWVEERCRDRSAAKLPHLRGSML